MSSDSTLRRISVAIVFPLLLPIFGGLWLTLLMVSPPQTEFKIPRAEFKNELEQGLIFAFSPLISWVNGMEKGGPPDERRWTTEAHAVLTQSPELLDIAWLISEQGTTKVFRHESRTESGVLPLEKIDGEIFSFVKKGERPYGFAYRDGNHAFFEFQIPLQTGSLFHGVLLARYSLPQFLTNLKKGLPADLSLVIWKGDEALARSNATSEKSDSFFVPVDIWGKKLTFEVQQTSLGAKQSHLALRWLGFLILMAVAAVCYGFREPDSAVKLDHVSAEWFAAAGPLASSPEANAGAAPPQDDGPLPVWALAQKERIADELKAEEIKKS